MRLLSAHRDGRYASRHIVLMTAKLRRHGSSHRFDVRVHDLSTTGFLCETVFGLRVGDCLSLILEGFAPLDSKIVWGVKDRYGCAFNRPLHIAVLDHILRTQQRG